eukprot:6177838-Pleurochrysis_carterae.AAC.4
MAQYEAKDRRMERLDDYLLQKLRSKHMRMTQWVRSSSARGLAFAQRSPSGSSCTGVDVWQLFHRIRKP